MFTQKYNLFPSFSLNQQGAIFSLAGLLLLGLNSLKIDNPLLGTSAFLLFIIPLCLHAGRLLPVSNTPERLLWGGLSVISLTVLLTTGTYYLLAITPFASIGICIILMLLYFLPVTPSHPVLDSKNHPAYRDMGYAVATLLIDSILFFLLFTRRTDALLPSPWEALPFYFFILFGIGTFFLFKTTTRPLPLTLKLFLNSIHLFIMYGVAVILYQIGYGFDAFIHRATEEWIAVHGFINPKSPYYIGQYSFVAWLHHLTQLSVHTIDIYLVPIISALFIPGVVWFTLKKVWHASETIALSAHWFIAAIPFLSLHLTTPHNLVLFWGIIIPFTAIGYTHKQLPGLILLLLSAAPMATHPLVGAPLFIFSLSVIVIQCFMTTRRAYLIGLAIATATITLLVPGLFFLNNLRHGQALAPLTNPLANLKNFFILFQDPYWYKGNGGYLLELLYSWEKILPVLVFALGILGAAFYERSEKKKVLLWVAASVGCILSALLLRNWIVFPEVIRYEQGDYPLRLIKASILFLLPWSIYTLMHFFSFIKSRLQPARFWMIVPLILASTLTVSFYLSYPQRNKKVQFPGYNITASDVKAVEWIHEQHTNYTYIVLANQLISAAALQQYSFAKHFTTPRGEIFYYAIPTGGPLYEQYENMIYKGQKREYMEQAMDIAGVDTAYFVINKYWARSNEIVAGASASADAAFNIDDGNLWIFRYNRTSL